MSVRTSVRKDSHQRTCLAFGRLAIIGRKMYIVTVYTALLYVDLKLEINLEACFKKDPLYPTKETESSSPVFFIQRINHFSIIIRQTPVGRGNAYTNSTGPSRWFLSARKYLLRVGPLLLLLVEY